MAIQELEIFQRIIPPDPDFPQSAEFGEISHGQLLDKAFNVLDHELSTHGNTQIFLDLRARYSDILLRYWGSKLMLFRQAQMEGKVLQGQEYTNGGETLRVSQLGVYMSDDEVLLFINRKTLTEEDEMSVSAGFRGEIDEALRPPTIQSKIKTDPTESFDIAYKVIFESNRLQAGQPFRISRFERKICYEDQEHQRPWIYDERVIRCSTAFTL